MIFARRRIRGISIQHPLRRQTPSRIEDERLRELTEMLLAGDDSVKGEIIAGHIHLAISIAGQYAVLAPEKAEVLASESIYGVIYAVEKAREKRVNNLGGYISRCCHRFAYKFLCDDHVVKIPRMTAWRRKKLGLEAEFTNIEHLNGHTPTVRHGSSMYDLRDLIQSAAIDEVDKEILRLRSMGYNDEEVGQMLEPRRKKSYVAVRRQRMYETVEAQLT